MKKADPFKTQLAKSIFSSKYALTHDESWWERASTVVDSICGTNGNTTHPLMSKEERHQLTEYIYQLKFLPGGRYLYYAGRGAKFYNNCYLLKGEEDTREEWSNVTQRAMSCLMTGGGIGIDYSVFRPSGKILSRTGGEASGPIPLAAAINEIGRNVKQGGSRRSAIYASLNWGHEDSPHFLRVKNWDEQQITGEYTVADAKSENFDYPAVLDMTNISLNYDDGWLDKPDREKDETFLENCKQALRTGEPGFSFNFREKQNETLRNAYESVRPH